MQTCSKHKDQQIDLICLESACKSHVACVQCVIEDHSEHPEQCLFIDDILNNNIKLENSKVIDFVTKLRSEQDLVSVVDREFVSIQNEILLKFDGFSEDLQVYYNQLTPREIQQKEIEFFDLLKNVTSCQEIVKLYQSYQSGNISKANFNQELNAIINKPEIEQNKQQIFTIYKCLLQQSLKLQKKDLIQIQNDILETLQEIPKLLSLEKSIQFYSLQGNKSTIENGNIITITSQDQQVVIVSQNTFSYPNKYQFTIQVEQYDTSQNQQLQVGFAHHSKLMNYNYFYRQNSSAYFGLSNTGRINFSVQKPEGKIIGESVRLALKEKRPAHITISLDIQNKQCLLQYEDIKIEYSKKKCSKLGFGGETGAEQFFQKNKKFVMFFIGNLADMKCKVV
ncbi:unnamed protein product [Paramecium octaurelia]|uniref:Uncharacterized protein n=1 Tax=Paramecium octaurelia TaxID=43137 RepID=A0A8S1U1I2_PAROT|nr:unnamed protein product [Paramecium octaurelia]